MNEPHKTLEPKTTLTVIDLGTGQGVARIEKTHYVNGSWTRLIIMTPSEVLDNGHAKPAASIEVGLSIDVVRMLKEAL